MECEGNKMETSIPAYQLIENNKTNPRKIATIVIKKNLIKAIPSSTNNFNKIIFFFPAETKPHADQNIIKSRVQLNIHIYVNIGKITLA